MNRIHKLSAALTFCALSLVFTAPIGSAQTPAPMPAVTMADGATPPLLAKFAVNISSRNAKVGDVVSAKTIRAAKLSDGTEVPKGSKIIGKVGSVQSKKDGNGNAMMTFRFEQIVVKGGQTVPVHGLVVAIGPPMSPHDLFGANSVMNRGGTGSSNGLDPNLGQGTAGAMDEDNIRLGSTMPDVSLGRHMDADWTTALRGVKADIDLDPDLLVKVQLK